MLEAGGVVAPPLGAVVDFADAVGLGVTPGALELGPGEVVTTPTGMGLVSLDPPLQPVMNAIAPTKARKEILRMCEIFQIKKSQRIRRLAGSVRFSG
jgi:hypothetical protein